MSLLFFFSQPVSGLEHDNSLYKFLDVLLRIVGSTLPLFHQGIPIIQKSDMHSVLKETGMA